MPLKKENTLYRDFTGQKTENTKTAKSSQIVNVNVLYLYSTFLVILADQRAFTLKALHTTTNIHISTPVAVTTMQGAVCASRVLQSQINNNYLPTLITDQEQTDQRHWLH